MSSIIEDNRQKPIMEALEMEELNPLPDSRERRYHHHQQQYQSSSSLCNLIHQLLLLCKLYLEVYPQLAILLALTIGGVMFFVLITTFASPSAIRNVVSEDYSNLDMHYNFKLAKIDHWCLWGGDDKCQCEDFTDPVGRVENNQWVFLHRDNVKSIQKGTDYDVVFYGDDFVELWNGTLFGERSDEGGKIKTLFYHTFTMDGGGQFEGLPLGIAGDTTTNLLWRLDNGEMPSTLKAKVFWLWIGTNDLAQAWCSEEVVVLGILRTAEEIAIKNPGSVVVIQGILPRSHSTDGSLDAPQSHSLFHHSEKSYSVKEAHNLLYLWPSIQRVNKELEDFCRKHEHLVYFDAASLFIGTMGNAHYRQKTEHIMAELMPDYVHPSFLGYKILAEAIKNEIGRILFDDDEANDIVPKPKALL